MNSENKKYIFITGGVASSLGKGLASASLACLLERRGIKISMLKMDPYINVDPGTMSPTQHGEVFVTDDGAETDLDLGHYERFTSLTLSKTSNFTTGQVYLNVIENEREGKYLGKTVQVVPHITNEIKRRIFLASESSELLLAEIGGTVGDMESLPFLEAIRQFSQDVGTENVLFIHLVLMPFIKSAGELKSKPAQHSVRELRSIGLFPNMIICRSDREIEEGVLEKISLFCNVSKENVFSSIDLDSIYKVPLNFQEQKIDEKVVNLLGKKTKVPDMEDIKKAIYNFEHPLRKVKIGIVGKYTDLTESYKSIDEALRHAALNNQLELDITYVDSDEITKGSLEFLDGVLVPGGFGERGTEGKIEAIAWARENKIPYFGICLGMQLAIVEFARNVCKIKDATSEEFSKKGSNVVHYMEDQTKRGRKGASMRLGAYECEIKEGTLAKDIYKSNKISERHRHRLEVNNKYKSDFEENGMVISGENLKLDLVELVELKEHPFFIGCQYHPEFKSKPFSAHPLFNRFIIEADKVSKEKK